MAYNQPYMMLPIRNFYPYSSTIILEQSVMVHNQHVWLHWTTTPKLHTYPSKGLVSLQTGFLIIYCISFDVTLP